MEQLERRLRRIDGKSYGAYKQIRGVYDMGGCDLIIDHVQADPFASPSRIRMLVPWAEADLPEHALGSPGRRRAATDFIARAFRRRVANERAIRIEAGGQTVLDRSACLFVEKGIELRFTVSLPAAGRRVLGRQAYDLLCGRLVDAVQKATLADNLDLSALRRHCDVVEDQVALRSALDCEDLVAFLAEGSVLPRHSGIDDRPLVDGIPLQTPQSLRVELNAPNVGVVVGLGVSRGITLVVGGGFHGKSTLLRAIEQGVWDHVPGDGRELVVTDSTAAKVRAEDGRAVSGVDISPFIDGLPGGKSTTDFSTDLASGSTSQAAAVVESVEAGSRVLLIDEDTSATNFMIRDTRMQALVGGDKEPITPFVDRVAELNEGLGVSTVLVMGGSGDYFDHAQTVIHMDEYRPVDVTAAALEVSRVHVTGRHSESGSPLLPPHRRCLEAGSLKPESKPGRRKIQVRGLDALVFGRGSIDLRAVEQLVDPCQVRAIGWLLARLADLPAGPVESLPHLEGWLARLVDEDWDWLTGRPDGDLALPRAIDALAVLNRVRGASFE